MDEFSFINSIKQNTYKQSSIVKGIGDDAAVFRQSSEDIVIAKDMFVEGVHFTKQTMDAFHVGYRALAANLSDLAAMGAIPAFYLVAIAIPESWSEGELDQVYKGMKELGEAYQMDLIGGDTISGNDLTISVTVIGYTEKSKASYRSNSQDGDVVFVTGTLGDSQAGFHIINHHGQYIDEVFYKERHRMPTPRIEFVRELQGVSRVCLNDISDGIASEAIEIAQASHVNLHIFDEKLPVRNTFDQFPQSLQHKWKLFGGEDFEILGTVSKDDWAMVEEAAKKTNTKLTNIGYVKDTIDTTGNVFLHRSNEKVEQLEKKGYNHLRR
ncbi:thiamine-phosphate kinase [Ornithinibacillus sp. L9]|uniref:Thiamine-monophosphate kinase n=1 Tax=Ornithinibacillus caprae TaxID=2678566 RepID=A0A6N8FGC3_9BACI|nr:thiamine-phosphate kinase [Ornithinibacillus caprae]MUK88533.1 thiamine-phosphate kinase [Ornithinibacillus caprae]